ncbi:hypothetical protein VP01_1541g5 [Puccinia sorghi]|uniref:Uncharacterized protein n=1 Tax=Puccinia sorghi TaxID=27349 RepID=A0A0L6VID1_9BASI|nr:hypothetical protein VP01_1541g5 [Puccinia sorghi]
MSRTLNTARSNGQTIGRRPTQTPAATPHETTKTIMLTNKSSVSQVKPSRLKLPAQSKTIPHPHTPATLRRGNSTLKLVSGLASPAQTPLMTIKRDNKSRLPRAAPTPTIQTPAPAPAAQTPTPTAAVQTPATLNISNPGTKRLRVKKGTTFKVSSSIGAPSLSSSLAPTPEPPASESEPKTCSSDTLDPDSTPKKPSSRNFKPNLTALSTSIPDEHFSSKIPAPPSVTGLTQKTSIVFPSIVEELNPRRPMTRARSKQILDQSNSSLGVPQGLTTAIPQVKRKTSRVMQMAQAFQQEAMANDSNSKSLLGVTPPRRASNASNASVVSPTDSLMGNSPNISALAASLSKQHTQRDRLSRSRSARSSVTDMLRYSTMSTLGGLHWEDGAGDVLLTDPNETEAMVADISMSRVTPLKPEVQSAAIALASARANFLSIVQENETETMENIQTGTPRGGNVDGDHPVNSPSTNSLRINKRPSFGSLQGPNPRARSRISIRSISSNSPFGQVVAHESQLAALSSSLEQAHQRELELKQEIQRLTKVPLAHNHATEVGATKKLSDQERESSLVEEIKRLEAELEESKELNIELENSLDLVKFENLENLNKYVKLQEEHDTLLAELATPQPPPSSKSKIAAQLTNYQMDDDGVFNFEKSDAFSLAISSEISAIKDHLKLISFIKISLALGSDFLLPLPHPTPSDS